MDEEITVKILQLQNEALQKQLAEAKKIIQEKTLMFSKLEVVEKALHDSNRKLNTLINNLKGVVYRCKNDRDWTMEYISQGITELTGYPVSDFIDNKLRSFNSIIAPRDQESVWINWQSSLDKKQYFTNEYRIITSTGEERWVWERGCGIFEDGLLVALEGFITDITDRKKAVQKLEDEKIRLKTLIETIPDLVWLKDTEGSYITCNRRFEKFLGAKESEIRGKSDYDFMSKELADFFRQKDKDAIIANKPTINLEWVTYADDGHHEYLETIKTPLFDSLGNLIGVLGISRDMTENHRNEELLKEKDLIFQSLLDNSPVYVFFKDQNIRAVHLSKNFEEMLGRPIDDILGKDMNDLFPSELAKSMIEDDKRILNEGKLVQVDEELNGRYYTTIKFPIVHENGNPMLAGFTIDITDRKMMELALQQSEARLSAFMNYIPALILIKDEQLRPVYVNDNFRKYFPADEWMGKTPNELFSEEVADIMVAQDRLALEKGFVTYEEDWTDIGGVLHTYHTQKFRIDIPGSNPLLGAIITDITARKKAQQNLLESEEKFRSYVENAPVGIFIINQEGYHIDVNTEACLLLGYSKEELVGMHASKVILSDSFGKGPDSFNAIETNDKFNFEFLIQRKDGSVFNGLLSAVKIADNQVLGFLKNIDDIVNVQKELIIAKEKAEESDKLKTAFLQNMSHEIRTPMNAIIGFSEILPTTFNDKPKLEYYTKIIGQRCSDLLGIIDEILDIAKIESGHLVVHYEKCNLYNWITELDLFLTEYQKRIRKEHIEFRILNEFPKNMMVVIDQGKIKQILINLINNSFKFTEKGKIEVGCKIDGQQLAFCVSDTGIGIPKEKQKIVFDRFAQSVQIGSQVYGGTGLGLAIVKGLLDVLGGNIWLESEFGRGTTFYFTVPYQEYNVDFIKYKSK